MHRLWWQFTIWITRDPYFVCLTINVLFRTRLLIATLYFLKDGNRGQWDDSAVGWLWKSADQLNSLAHVKVEGREQVNRVALWPPCLFHGRPLPLINNSIVFKSCRKWNSKRKRWETNIYFCSGSFRREECGVLWSAWCFEADVSPLRPMGHMCCRELRMQPDTAVVAVLWQGQAGWHCWFIRVPRHDVSILDLRDHKIASTNLCLPQPRNS